jgi:cellulose synthase/poly-beta-1,6-N-acetylglucosamine synthase-like glycosyltransferase
MLALLVLIYLKHKNDLFTAPEPKELEGVSIVMPCYNESKTIGMAIESLLELDYPQDKIEILVVDDCSKDNSVEIVRPYTKKYKNVKLIINSRNSGGAAEPTNLGVMAAKYDYIAVADSDSTPKKEALKKMIGFLQEDPSVGGVTCSVLVKNPKSFIQKLQATEYAVIAFSRKLLDKVDAVYVTPGPFALYRKKTLIEVGLFDTKNMTQDIEIVWRMLSKGYKARMCLATSVYSESPSKFWPWVRQRIRWNIGGIQTIIKYKKLIFRKGIFGLFIIPFFVFSLVLGLIGLALLAYLYLKRTIIDLLVVKYAFFGSTTLLRLQDLTFAPSLLNYFGVVVFILGTTFNLFSLAAIKDKQLGEKHKVFSVSFYLIVYLTLYPLLLIASTYKFLRGKYSW